MTQLFQKYKTDIGTVFSINWHIRSLFNILHHVCNEIKPLDLEQLTDGLIRDLLIYVIIDDQVRMLK